MWTQNVNARKHKPLRNFEQTATKHLIITFIYSIDTIRWLYSQKSEVKKSQTSDRFKIFSDYKI